MHRPRRLNPARNISRFRLPNHLLMTHTEMVNIAADRCADGRFELFHKPTVQGSACQKILFNRLEVGAVSQQISEESDTFLPTPL